MINKEVFLKDAESTLRIGVTIGKNITAGAVLLLSGDLGAGKTTLVKGIARGARSADAVSSPTFALVNVYEGDCVIYHFDLYRLKTTAELEDIGFFEMLESGGIVIVEWADKFAGMMPSDAVRITMKTAPDGDGRILQYEAEYDYIGD